MIDIETFWLDNCTKNAYYSEMYAQLTTVRRRIWVKSRAELLNRIKKKKYTSLYK